MEVVVVRVLFNLFCSIAVITFVAGCGGSEEVGGTNLNTEDSKNHAAEAAAAYSGAGRTGPGAPAAPGATDAPAAPAAPAQK